MGLPGIGLKGYVFGFVISDLLGVILNWVQVRRATGLKARIFQWCTAPGLSALLMGLVVNLLFKILLNAGMDGIFAVLSCLVFGTVLYLAALAAQGIRPGQIFRLR